MMRRKRKYRSEKWLGKPIYLSGKVLKIRFIPNTPMTVVIGIVVVLVASEIMFNSSHIGEIIKTHSSVISTMEERSMITFLFQQQGQTFNDIIGIVRTAVRFIHQAWNSGYYSRHGLI